MIRYEVVDKDGKRVALCNSKRLAESYKKITPNSKIIIVKGVINEIEFDYTETITGPQIQLLKEGLKESELSEEQIKKERQDF
jgi:hypothetical protein